LDKPRGAGFQPAEIPAVFRQEDLTTQPESLKALVEEVTAGKLSPTSEWCREALQIRAVNPHVNRQVEFAGWRLDVLRQVVTPAAWKAYTDLGYPTPVFL